METMFIKARDESTCDIQPRFEDACRFLGRFLDQGRRVLVACVNGKSLSPTVAAAYLIRARHMLPTSAVDKIRRARPVGSVNPNSGFLQQLSSFSRQKTHTSAGQQQ